MKPFVAHTRIVSGMDYQENASIGGGDRPKRTLFSKSSALNY
jgi:hypothetical protein